ncbi:flagellar basal body L-ring protein FlgH [Nereida sp. MMG025]|uniref:flagellar basal body L-ring protein FlgH n=1 Tax=Nereida sp. MMG025 TaxID=2909981 RepID=UPI001F3D53E0|nr:flagellar basal body L-ring protein FlgH [Nereida sp. MMG025]MCF6444678.1 flagellar basal body L-ring protein FlgH [Nereida sp. MMG025]
MSNPSKALMCGLILAAASGCARLEKVGKHPEFTPTLPNAETQAMLAPVVPRQTPLSRSSDQSSLWSGERQSLLGDRRAVARGDILTVVIEIDDRAEFSNSSQRSRNGSESMRIPNLLGIPQRLDQKLPEGATMGSAVDLSGSSSASGDGSVSRNERLTLRVAATIVEVLPNGVLSVQGSQEVRVNFELRELLVSGYVRPEDVSRQNEVTYDKMASARISYGGRGQISDMQQPRYGQQALDAILPF